MAEAYQRDKNGIRLDLTGGMNTMLPADAMQQGFPYLQNVRRNLAGRAVSRPPLGGNVLIGALASGVKSLIRINDVTPLGPASGYALILGADSGAWVDDSVTQNQVASNLSGNPLSFVTFRPNASPQPWCYVADAPSTMPVDPYGPPAINLLNPAYPATIAGCTMPGMFKVRSDQTTYKTGITEPQAPPTINPAGGSGPNWAIYRYTYRSSATGAVSNPSPESFPVELAQTPVNQALIPSSANQNSNFTYNASQYEINGTDQFFRTKGGVSGGTVTDYVVAHNFGFNIDPTKKIDGIVAALTWAGQQDATGYLVGVALYYQGGQIGQVKSPGVANVNFLASKPTVPQGANNDSWGTVLTPDIVNDPTFGFGVQIAVSTASPNSRSFLYEFAVTVYYTDVNEGVNATPSTDPQVDKIDFYRQDPGLASFTYVGTVPNDIAVNPSQTLNDSLSALAAAANPLLEFDNYEPFPSIDLPRKGTVDVVAATSLTPPLNFLGIDNVVRFASGQQFNPRWLPGTIILIGGTSQKQAATAYTLYSRPFPGMGGAVDSLIAVNITTDPTTGNQIFAFPPAGTGYTYEIAEPTLAAQPSPAIWGPTPDNYGSFYFGLDPLNPGDLLWSKGNNFDSAPDTNRMFVTSPSEPLMNGTVTAELSTVFSTERFWLVNWNFADALATVTGVEGQQWTLTQAAATRGLYMRYAIAALGSTIAYRAKDCIAVSSGGGQEQSVTDEIYNLFPHAGAQPTPVTIGGQTVYPPDDTNPRAQTITLTPSYLFYNYQDINGTQRTLVYDFNGKGWSVDQYSPLVNAHHWAIAPVAQLLTGCADGTVRMVGGTPSTETGSSIILTRSENGGEDRAFKRVGDVFIKALVNNAFPVSVALWQARFTTLLTGFAPTSLTGTGALAPYIVDFTSGFASDVIDIGAVLSWGLGSTNILDLWQPDWIDLPEMVQSRPTDWTDCGVPGNKLIRGMVVEMDSFNTAKVITVERSDDAALIAPAQTPVTVNGQTLVPFSFIPPFTGHMLRLVTTDGVPWRMWGPDARWVADPWPEYITLYSPWMNMGRDEPKYIRSLTLPLDTNGLPATFDVISSDGDVVTFSATTPPGVKSPTGFAFTPPIVAHEVRIRMKSNAGMWPEEAQWEADPYPELIPALTPIMEINGPDNKFFQGIKLVGDSNGLPVSFKVLYDGGQTGPTLGPVVFNGKQTQVFSFSPPFNAHDVQIVPQQPCRLWMPGMGAEDASAWVSEPAPDAATTWTTEASSFGLLGWIHIYQIALAYVSTTPVTLTISTDQGPIVLTYPPSTGGPGVPSKIMLKVPRNKWKVASFSVTSSTPVQLWKDLTEVWMKSWGTTGEYMKINPFGAASSDAARI